MQNSTTIERETETETERQTDRQTERQRERSDNLPVSNSALDNVPTLFETPV